MDQVEIDELLNVIPGLRAHKITEGLLPHGIWFDLTVKPIPTYEELGMVTYDIYNDNFVHLINNIMLSHSNSCNEKSHNLDKNIRKAIKHIDKQTFKIAIYEGNDSILDGQPIVISMEPEISHIVYPDHPHLNCSGYYLGDTCIPNSFCYTDNPKVLGDDPYSRVLNTIRQACIWLFKHEVWLATRKFGNAVWIGPQVDFDEKNQFVFLRNPYGKCYCGSNELYHKCHLNYDFINECLRETVKENSTISYYKNNDDTINLDKYLKLWLKVHFSISLSLKQLKKELL